MWTIKREDKEIGTINTSTFALSTQDSELKKLYAGWQESGILVIAPAGRGPEGIFADAIEMVKPSAKKAGIVQWALEREGYTVA